MDTRSARSRGAAAIVASMALLGSGAAITTTPALSAPPAADCAEAFPVSSVTRGQPVDGLTVTEGTTPTAFSGEVIEVLRDGIAPGVDMIIADLANPTGDPAADTRIDEVGGIWQGMSGSPVYAQDGRLLGAVAYGLSWGPSTVAGITPYEAMSEYLPEPPAEVAVPRGVARAIAAESDVSRAEASEGLSELRVPLTITGITSSRLGEVRSAEEGHFLRREGHAGRLVGAAGPGSAPDGSTVVDGGNLGAAISYGTITAGGVGTVTDRCGDDVVGFGHPMMFRGATSMGLMPADALYVQKESLGAPFKVANLAPPAGTITQDRLAGVTGVLGDLPDEVDIASDVRYGARERSGLSHSLSPEWNTDVTLMQLLRMHDVTIDAIQPGSEESGVVITLATAEGEVTLETSDRYVSDYDIAVEGLWPIAELVYVLTRLDDAEITAISTESDVRDDASSFRIGRMEQRLGGTWTKVNRRIPALVRPGRMLRLRTELKDGGDSQWLVQRLPVPAKARGEGRLEAVGGAWTWNDSLWEAESLAEVQEALDSDVRNDQVRTDLSFWSRRADRTTTYASEPQALVVRGRRVVSVVALRR